jgi:hypothetical protein
MSNFDEKEKKIQEQRTIEAIKKGLMGASGKFGAIVKNLGTPIIGQGSDNPYLESTYLPELDGEPANEFDPQDAEEFSSIELGWIWDGLSAGIHMEIKYIEDAKELTVYHKGYLVYREVSGELLSYLPNEEWEEPIERVYLLAKRKEKDTNKSKKQDRVKLGENLKSAWLRKIRDRWGI